MSKVHSNILLLSETRNAAGYLDLLLVKQINFRTHIAFIFLGELCSNCDIIWICGVMQGNFLSLK